MPLVSRHSSTDTPVSEVHAPDCARAVDDLSNANPSLRRRAARELVDCHEASPVLVAHLMTETDVAVREVIASSLISLADADAVRGFIGCLRSEDAALRNLAIGAMQQMPNAVGPIIDGLLSDTDSDVRIFAMNILEFLPHPSVESWLIDAIERDPHVNVCSCALDVLREVGTERCVPAVKALKVRFADEAYIQFAANLTLRRVRGS
jgi:HEAT repeat protein